MTEREKLRSQLDRLQTILGHDCLILNIFKYLSNSELEDLIRHISSHYDIDIS